MKWAHNKYGFTIVELLIVIVVIAILAAITVVAYSGIRERALDAQRESDISTYMKAIVAAREATNQTLMEVTGSGWSVGRCSSVGNNPDGIEPKDLPKTHTCWQRYYINLELIGEAAGMNLDGLRSGDPNGNPYMFDENEGENGGCSSERILVFTGNGVDYTSVRLIPHTGFTGC